MYDSSAVWALKSLQNPYKMVPKGARGYPLEGPERPKTAQEHPGAPQETPRNDQKATQRASESPLEALWGRLERSWGVVEGFLRGDLDTKMEIHGGSAHFMKIMLAFDSQHGF